MLDLKEEYRPIKEALNKNLLEVYFRKRGDKQICLVKQDHFMFGFPAETNEEALVKIAEWVLPDFDFQSLLPGFPQLEQPKIKIVENH